MKTVSQRARADRGPSRSTTRPASASSCSAPTAGSSRTTTSSATSRPERWIVLGPVQRGRQRDLEEQPVPRQPDGPRRDGHQPGRLLHRRLRQRELLLRATSSSTFDPSATRPTAQPVPGLPAPRRRHRGNGTSVGDSAAVRRARRLRDDRPAGEAAVLVGGPRSPGVQEVQAADVDAGADMLSGASADRLRAVAATALAAVAVPASAVQQPSGRRPTSRSPTTTSRPTDAEDLSEEHRRSSGSGRATTPTPTTSSSLSTHPKGVKPSRTSAPRATYAVGAGLQEEVHGARQVRASSARSTERDEDRRDGQEVGRAIGTRAVRPPGPVRRRRWPLPLHARRPEGLR